MSIYSLHPTPPAPVDAIARYSFKTQYGPSLIVEETDLWKELLVTKSKIDDLPSTHVWDDAKRITNPYETIHMPGYRGGTGLASYVPLSRSYFKMVEMLVSLGIYNQFANDTKLITAHIAEGPGGFIEALLRKCPSTLNVETCHAITLKSTDAHIPGWKKSKDFLATHKQIRVSYGEDGTGDILKLSNCTKFISTVGEGHAHIVTADGGFDFSEDFNTQEQQSAPLVAASLFIALHIQAQGGILICKVFDTMTRLNFELLFVLCHIYERVALVKPLTSRPANSERYIVGFGFRGIGSNAIFDALATIITGTQNVQSILPGLTLPTGFLTRMSFINKTLQQTQLVNICATLELIASSDYERAQKSSELRRQQTELGKKWCIQYGESLKTR